MFGAGLECAGDGVGEDAVEASFGQCIMLKLLVLVASGESGVPEEMSMGLDASILVKR